MVGNLGVLQAEAFRRIHPGSPLNKLSESDLRLLYSLLLVYAQLESAPREKPKEHEEEKLAKLAVDASRIATMFEKAFFQEALCADLFCQLAGPLRDAAQQFITLAQLLGGTLEKLGKPGHKERNERIVFFILATEFVRLKTGKYHDAHLADFYQFIWERSAAADLSAEEVRKKRKSFQRTYPDLYAEVLTLAKRMCGRGVTAGQS